MSSQRILAAFHCDRSTWFKWKNLCRAHGTTVEKATEVLIQEALQRLGIERPEESSAAANPEVSMVRSP